MSFTAVFDSLLRCIPILNAKCSTERNWSGFVEISFRLGLELQNLIMQRLKRTPPAGARWQYTTLSYLVRHT